MDKETERLNDPKSRREAARERAEAAVRARLQERERASERKKERLLERRAREREDDIRAGRPERGLFTGRGRHEDDDDGDDDGFDDREDELDDDLDDDLDDHGAESRNGDSGRPRTGLFGLGRARRRAERATPRSGAKRSVVKAITQLPAYLRLLVGLISDGRVSKIDRFFVIAAAAYIVSPVDFIPDVIPFLGQVDDLFLLMIALQRLVNNAGRSVLLRHWKGNPKEVHNLNFARIVSAAGFFLPNAMKRRLFSMAGGKRKNRS